MRRHTLMTFSLSIAAIAGCGDDRAASSSGFSVVTGAPVVTTASVEPAATTTGATPTGEATPSETTSGAGGSGGTSSGEPPITVPDKADPPTGEVAETSADGVDPRFDLGGGPDVGVPLKPDTCRGVDLLFVVDDSGSMMEEQASLVASFPGFVAEIESTLAHVEGLHIGVVTTDAYKHNDAPCDNVLGALVTRTGGINSSHSTCGPYTGGRFMTEADELAQRFACAGQVGTSGDSVERPIAAAMGALGPELAGPGGCNEGFFRPDALLVVVIVTDEEDEGSDGTPAQWFNELAGLKGGVESNVVVLALIGPVQPLCGEAADIAFKLQTFAGLFTHGSVGQICAETYQPFFHDSIVTIAAACQEFTPPG